MNQQQPLQTPPPQQPGTPVSPPASPNRGESQGGPFETPPMAEPNSGGQGFQPTSAEPPRGGGKTWILIVILLVFLIAGGLVFTSWMGWISLGGLEKYWKKTETANTTQETTQTTSTSNTNTYTANANDSTRKIDLSNIKTALKKYYQANQSYPVATTSQKTLDPSCVLTKLVPNDLAKLPVDPLSPTYYYAYTSDGKTFELTAVLEDNTDPAGIKVNETLYIYKVTDSSTETTSSSTTE